MDRERRLEELLENGKRLIAEAEELLSVENRDRILAKAEHIAATTHLIDRDALIKRAKNIIGDGAGWKAWAILNAIQEAKTVGYCENCARNADNGGLYPDGRTKCPIQEHYALLMDGHCHLYSEYTGKGKRR